MEIWRAFRELLPTEPLMAGEVAFVHGDGTSTVTLPGGGTMRVRGDGFTQGTWVWVRGGEIRGEAPALTTYDIEV
jgi:hypothetical protein